MSFAPIIRDGRDDEPGIACGRSGGAARFARRARGGIEKLAATAQPAGDAPAPVRHWLFARRATSFAADDRPAPSLRDSWPARSPRSARGRRRLSSSDGTEKLLLRLDDGHLVECVLLKEADRRTVCVSTQVGCGMGCVFCASGIEGVVRNLTAGEILEQLLHARNLLPADDGSATSSSWAWASRWPTSITCSTRWPRPRASDGPRLSARHVTISTVGLPGQDPPARRPGQAVSPGRVAARPQRRAAQPHRAHQRQGRARRHPRRGRLFLPRPPAGR